MNLTSFITKIAVCGGALMMYCSCGSNDAGTDLRDESCYDFATFVSSNDKGSVFTLRKAGDSPLVTLTSDARIDNMKLQAGTRVLIQYVPSGGQAPYVSGPIDLLGIGRIINGAVESHPNDTIMSWPSSPIKLTSMNRSGEYVDIWAQGDFTTKINRFDLVADEETVDDAVPSLRLVFEGDRGIGYPHQIYASFDINDIWSMSSCRGIDITYLTAAGEQHLTLYKSDNQ